MVALEEQVKSSMVELKEVKAQQKKGTKSAVPLKLTKLNLPVYDGTGPVNKFLKRYEGYACVQDLMEQCTPSCPRIGWRWARYSDSSSARLTRNGRH